MRVGTIVLSLIASSLEAGLDGRAIYFVTFAAIVVAMYTMTCFTPKKPAKLRVLRWGAPVTERPAMVPVPIPTVDQARRGPVVRITYSGEQTDLTRTKSVTPPG